MEHLPKDDRQHSSGRFGIILSGLASSLALAGSVLLSQATISVPYLPGDDAAQQTQGSVSAQAVEPAPAALVDIATPGKLVLLVNVGDKPATLTLPIQNFKGTIDWGDGTDLDRSYETNFSGEAVITRAHFPEHQHLLTLTGKVRSITTFGERNKTFVGIKAWDNDLGLTHFDVQNAHSFKIIPKNLPTTLTDLQASFSGSTFNSPNVSHWHTSRIINTVSTFADNTAFNQPLDWDLSNDRHADSMFDGATSFSQDLNDWKMLSLTSAESIFHDASHLNFNQVNEWTAPKLPKDPRLFVSSGTI